MLKQASISDITSGKLTRAPENTTSEEGSPYLVVCMRHYPRFLEKNARDEYVHELSPDEKLLADFNEMKRKLGDHNAAFRVVRYEQRFCLSPEAMSELKRLTELARTRDVYLICLCGPGIRCHRDLLLMIARRTFGAEWVETPRLSYSAYEKRLPTLL